MRSFQILTLTLTVSKQTRWRIIYGGFFRIFFLSPNHSTYSLTTWIQVLSRSSLWCCPLLRLGLETTGHLSLKLLYVELFSKLEELIEQKQAEDVEIVDIVNWISTCLDFQSKIIVDIEQYCELLIHDSSRRCERLSYLMDRAQEGSSKFKSILTSIIISFMANLEKASKGKQKYRQRVQDLITTIRVRMRIS